MRTLYRVGLLVAVLVLGLLGAEFDTLLPGGTDATCVGGKNPPYTSVTVCLPVAPAVE